MLISLTPADEEISMEESTFSRIVADIDLKLNETEFAGKRFGLERKVLLIKELHILDGREEEGLSEEKCSLNFIAMSSWLLKASCSTRISVGTLFS